ncbi:hypothetical protein ACFQZE_06785 [Paenibacillus sp. GCM10027627]|uniref:hypothetical protein n=1 Tax=unclassified Paenibacillus TaxID=185978 RepID=UPI003626E1E5
MLHDERKKKQFKQKDQKFTSNKFSKPKNRKQYKNELPDYQYEHYVEGVNLGREDGFEY